MSAKVDNYVGAYANVGEWTMLPTESKVAPSFGAAGSVGALYELQVGPMAKTTRFLLDIGLGMTGGMTIYKPSGTQEAILTGQYDLDGDLFDYVYGLKQRRDRYSDIAVNVPLMIGVQHKKFYMLAGVKMYAHAWTKTTSMASLDTYGRYKDIPDLHNQPEYQFFTGRPVSSSVRTTLNLDMDLSFEIGGRLGEVADAVGFDVPKRKIEYRLAAFADYGLLDLHKAGDAQALVTADKYDTDPTSPNYVYHGTSMVDNLTMNDIMSTSGFASKVSNLMIGLKFTVLFQLPEQGTCVICRDAYRKSTPRHGGRRGMKYEE